MLELVQLEGKSDRRPRELSGGQQQRVALARALVNRPRALLLDEPLAALDLKLRQAMQIELKRIQREVGITFIFVTHDQNEALTMSDRLVVMNAGRIEQLGSPREVYERPRTRFVAGFIGTSNLITGTRRERWTATTAVLETGRRRVARRPRCRRRPAPRSAQPLDLTVRPEKIVLAATAPTPAGARSAAASPRSSTSAPPRSTRCGPPTAASCWCSCRTPPTPTTSPTATRTSGCPGARTTRSPLAAESGRGAAPIDGGRVMTAARDARPTCCAG